MRAEGIDHTWLNLGHHECFARFTVNREFDVSELSIAKFSAQISRADSDIVGLPVICSRLIPFLLLLREQEEQDRHRAELEEQNGRFA